MIDDKYQSAADHAFALVEQANRFAKLASTMSAWEHAKEEPTEGQITAARAVLHGGTELRKSLWAVETVAETIVKAYDDAQEKRLDGFFEDAIEGL
jgi:hypothetical protein